MVLLGPAARSRAGSPPTAATSRGMKTFLPSPEPTDFRPSPISAHAGRALIHFGETPSTSFCQRRIGWDGRSFRQIHSSRPRLTFVRKGRRSYKTDSAISRSQLVSLARHSRFAACQCHSQRHWKRVSTYSPGQISLFRSLRTNTFRRSSDKGIHSRLFPT